MAIVQSPADTGSKANPALLGEQRFLNAEATGEVAVEISGLVKNYGDFPALKGANFTLRPGEVHALMGQNGAGKSTLIKVLAGVESSSGGTLKVFGKELRFTSQGDAAKAGIAVVYQDLSLIPTMSVADNLMLGREPTGFGGIIRRGEVQRRAKEILEAYGLPIDPSTAVEDLPFAYKQMTEIAKALLADARILILDEPTSALSEDEEGVLFDAVRNVVSRGVAVIYVTHRLDEVFKLCDRVTVMRDGMTEGTYATAELDMRSLAAAIVGPKQSTGPSLDLMRKSDARAAMVAGTSAAPVVELVDVSARKVQNVNLSVRKGEVIGLAGPQGSGRTEILETLFGLRKITAGTMLLNGMEQRFGSPLDAIQAGIGLVPEDRHAQGLVLSHGIEQNIAMPSLPILTRSGVFQRSASLRRAKQAMAELSVKATSASTVLSSLSGGNQQKVVFGKWGNPRCALLLLDEPTVGVDVGARGEIYGEIFKAAEQGTAVIVVSSDYSELLLLCDRLYIVLNQTVRAEVQCNEISGEEDLHHRVHLSSEPSQEASK